MSINFTASKNEIDKINTKFEELVEQRKIVCAKNPCFMGSKICIETAYLMQELLKPYNIIKAKLDKAYKSDDMKSFKTATDDIKDLLYDKDFHGFTLRFNRRRKFIKLTTPLKLHIKRQIAFIRNNVAACDKLIQRDAMTPAKRAAADKSSSRMREQWASF